MPSPLKYLIIIALPLGLASCDSKKKPSREDRGSENDFFKKSAATETLDTLQNELNRGETELLRKFAVDTIPWQKWDSAILEKARVRQTPLLLYIASGLSEDSRSIAVEISERKAIREPLMNKSVCAVADIQVNPELGILAHHLSAEINQPTAFPTLVWMSHEGAPIAWLPLSRISGKKLDIAIKSSSAMVNEIWKSDSRYTVSNSRLDNGRRQARFNSPSIEGDDSSRMKIFRTGTRGLSALYSEFDRNIDHTGGLMPTSSIELLSLGVLHPDFTTQVRNKCSLAVKEVSGQMISQALKDQLTGSYFYARRNTDWSLPIFSKNLETQANLARVFLNGGTITNNNEMISEGKNLLEVIENDWLAKPRSFIAPLSNPDRDGSFIINGDTLKKVLSESEIKLATLAFSLKPNGNIPDTVDPLGIFYQKNTLRRDMPLAGIASKLNQPEEAVSTQLEQIRKKLLAHRQEVTKFLSEPLISAETFARVLRAQISGANALNDDTILAKAINAASLLRKNYTHSSDGLSLFPVDSHFIPARSKDYSLCALAALELYQATLDPQWLQWSTTLMDEALQKLSRDGLPLRELPESEAIIPLAIHNRNMIFSDSSLGMSHHIFLQLGTLTGAERFTDMADLIAKDLSRLAQTSPVNHSDFIISCARGDSPLVAILQGGESAEGKTLLKSLNSPKFSPYISIRGGNAPKLLKELPQIPELSGNASVSLFRDNKLLGSATIPDDLNKLLSAKISEKE